jgi:diguanylate cyclase (GGDEF)-like protein
MLSVEHPRRKGPRSHGSNGGRPNRSRHPANDEPLDELIEVYQELISAAHTMGRPPPEPPPERVLVAEDDPELLRELDQILRSQGYEVITAGTGEEALALARAHMPRLIILDLAIKGPNGYEVCRRLRSDWRLASNGTFILTSESLARQAAIGLGHIDDFILKPFHSRELAARVRLALRRTGEMRSASPLTGLPGNVPLQQELQRRVRSTQPVSLLHIDVDHFKAYNDRYGFLRGDEAIRALAAVLRQAVGARSDAFLGHVGGDDFVVLAHPADAKELAEEVISGFQQRVVQLYDAADIARGWIELHDRRGRKRRFGLLTLSIGVSSNLGHPIEDARRLVDMATEMKRFAKSRPGNVISVDRRTAKDLEAEPLFERLGPPETTARHRGPRVGLGWRHPHRPTEVRSGGGPRSGRAPAKTRRRRLTSMIVAALAVMVAAGPATVVLAENARPGSILWPMKLGIERIQLAVERDPQRDIALHLEFASRRVGELRDLIVQGQTESLADSVINNMTEHTEAVRTTVSALVEQGDGTRVIQAQPQMDLSRNIEVLESLVAAACIGSADPGPTVAACPGLTQALESASGVMEMIREPPPRLPRSRAGTQPHRRVIGEPSDRRSEEPSSQGEATNGPTEAPGRGQAPPTPGPGEGSGSGAAGPGDEQPSKDAGAPPNGEGEENESPDHGGGGIGEAPSKPEPPGPPESPPGLSK